MTKLTNFSFPAVLGAFLLCYSVLPYDALCNESGDLTTESQKELLLIAGEVAAGHGYDVAKYDLKIGREEGFVTVTLWPKPLPDKDVVQVGGGCRLFFKSKGSKHQFVKIELWQ